VNEYVGLLGVLAGSALTGFLSIYLDRQRGARDAADKTEDRQEARNQREAEHEERRYRDRLDAYTALDAQVLAEVRKRDVWDRQQEMTPEDAGVEPELPALDNALVKVLFLANPDAEQAATQLSDATYSYAFGDATSEDLDRARRHFRLAARRDLGTRTRVTTTRQIS
jgi:hypothetical protein